MLCHIQRAMSISGTNHKGELHLGGLGRSSRLGVGLPGSIRMIELDGCHTPARLRLPYDGSEDPLVGKWSGDGVLRLSQNGVLPHHTTDNQPLSMRATATVT